MSNKDTSTKPKSIFAITRLDKSTMAQMSNSELYIWSFEDPVTQFKVSLPVTKADGAAKNSNTKIHGQADS